MDNKKEFTMAVAGQAARVRTLFESTKFYCGAYLTDGEPDFSVTVTPEDLVFEQDMADEEAKLEGFRRRLFPDPFLERAAIQRQFAEHLFGCDTLMFHGSVVAVDGAGYLFTARSGTGKSTHTRLWREVFGPRAVMVNDDKPFLRISASEILVCGSPWSGKHGLDTNITVPLKGICLLERGKENRIRPLEPAGILDRLRHECYQPLDGGKLPRLLELVDILAARTPLWHMECNKNPDAAEVAYAAMAGDP